MASYYNSFFSRQCEKKIAKKYNIKLLVQGRINDGGMKIDEKSEAEKSSEELVSVPDNWSVSRITELFHAICVPEMRDAFLKDHQEFIDELEKLGPTANNGIIARLISFKIDPEMK